MGEWSITPNDLAKIDENGLITFSKHESDVTYLVSYKDEKGTITKSITAKACSGPTDCNCNSLEITYEEKCTCTVKKDGYEVPAETSTTFYPIAMIEYSTSCGGLDEVKYVVEGSDADFLNDFSLDGEYIKAKVNSENESETDTKKAIYKIKIGECDKQITVTQMKKGENPCKCEKLNIELKTE